MKKLVAAVRLLLTLKCEESSHLVSESFDRDLSALERWAVRLHNIGCWSCRRFAQQIQLLREAMRSEGSYTESENQKLSSEAIDRIRETIRRAKTDAG